MNDTFLTVDGSAEAIYEEKHSKFICYVAGIKDEEDAKGFVAKIKKKNSSATHNVYAYIADQNGLVEKFSDDKEPQGTAGKPLLTILRAKNLLKTVTVVTRYFGGIKLGTGGLKRAYEQSLLLALEKAKIVRETLCEIFTFSFSYDEYSKFISLKFKTENKVTDTRFENEVTVEVAVPVSFGEEYINFVTASFGGKTSFVKKERQFFRL